MAENDQEPPEPDLPEPDEAGSESEDLPESPYTTEDVEFMVPDEVLAIRLKGAAIGTRSIPMAIAGPFMFRLHELIHAITSRIGGREPGTRGPLPPVEEAGLLALAALSSGASVTFHFEIGPGEVFQLDAAAETSLTQRALEIVTGLVESTAATDDQILIDMTRELGPRVGTDYVLMLRLLAQHHVESIWRPVITQKPIHLSVAHTLRSRLVLEERDHAQVQERVIRGWLYETNAKKREFLFEPVEGDIDRLTGTYGPELREDLRGAWDHEVELRVVVTEEYLRRQLEPIETRVELLEVLNILD